MSTNTVQYNGMDSTAVQLAQVLQIYKNRLVRNATSRKQKQGSRQEGKEKEKGYNASGLRIMIKLVVVVVLFVGVLVET